MKKFTLLMVAGLFALAGSVQAQDAKKIALKANDIQIANGEEAELVISIDYDTEETVTGANFDLYLPDGILLKGIESKEEMMNTPEEGGKASKRNFAKACTIDETCAWGEDGDNSFIYDFKAKSDKEGLLIILMDGDRLPFVSTHSKLITITVKATQDVIGTGTLKNIAIGAKGDVSLDLGNLADYTFAVNGDSQGINDIQAADATAPAYNLQGVRVNNNAKGVIIREGKKMIVK